MYIVKNKWLTSLTMMLSFLLGISSTAWSGFSIEPAVINIRADRGENSAWLDVVHTGGDPIAVELTVYERILDLDGEFKRDSLVKSNDFVVHPARLILTKGEKAKVQAVYKGKKATADKAYMLFSKEVPLQIDEGVEGIKVGINTLMNYYTVLAISTGKPGSLTFVSSKSIGDGMIEVIVENKSAGRVVGDRLRVTVGNKEIKGVTGLKNSIMPGQKRRLTFKYGRPVTAKEIKFEN